MSTETEFETWVRSQLAEVAQIVTPCPDPYGRLVRRRRFGRLGRVFLACAAALAAAATGTVVALAPAGHGPAPNPTNTYTGRLHWLASLLEAAPRGGVAQDAAFTADLAARMEQLARSGAVFQPSPGQVEFSPQGIMVTGDGAARPLGEQTARVLFADDIGDRRIALVALQSPDLPDVHQRYPNAHLAWLVGARGDSPQRLVDGGTITAGRIDPYAFFVDYSAATATRLAVVPPECTIDVAPMTDPDAWRPEPTGSYVVRTPAQNVPERWRVSCGGLVRQRGPAPSVATPEELAQMPESGRAQGFAAVLYGVFGFELRQPPQALWDGPVTGADAAPFVVVSAPVVTVVVAPEAMGGWVGLIDVELEQTTGTFTSISLGTFHTEADLADPGALLGVPLLGWNGEALVFAPAGAATVRLLGSDDSVLAEASVVDQRVALLRWDVRVPQPVRAQALDASGAVMATTELARTGVAPERVSDWS